MLDRAQSLLVFIDVQGRLAEAMDGRDDLFRALRILLSGAVRLDVPVLWTEQLPGKLGATAAELAACLPGRTPIAKHHFSCWGEPAFRHALEQSGRRQVALCGIETHVCVYQTARDLLSAGYEVEVVGDAVSSRRAAHRELALRKLRGHGVQVTCVETLLLEWLRDSADPAFRDILTLIK